MTAPATATAAATADEPSPAAPPDRGPSRSWRTRWQAWRWPVAVTAVVLMAGLTGLLLLRPGTAGSLDPTSPAPQGTRALAEVLRQRGIEVLVRDRIADVAADLAAANGDVTVMVARPDLIPGPRGPELAGLLADARADLVVVGADNRLLADLGVPVGARAGTEPRLREPGCTDPRAARAGSAIMGGIPYSRNDIGANFVVDRAVACYPAGGGHSYLALTDKASRTITLLGSGQPLTNDRLADAGDAALALGVLGAQPRLIWWTPNPLDGATSAEPPGLVDLLPPGVTFAGVQLVVVLLVAVLWRGRRLGRLVPEPLPVVVHAVETTRGRAQLYRRARARGRAAQVLRAAATRRLAVRCGLSRTAPADQVAARIASVVGRPVSEITPLLVGADPADDVSLVLLARDLDSLETEVHRS